MMGTSVVGNSTPISSCMYSTIWSEKNSWILSEEEFYSNDQITSTAPQLNYKNTKEDESTVKKEKKGRGYKHVPHKDKPVQVVARRNARERRRVQAVNSAFARLRKIVPVENTRGKRISKVKTLLNAIDYIHNLQQLLEQDRNHQPFQVISHYCSYRMQEDFLEEFNL